METDLHYLSHRGLTNFLIPQWLRSPDCDLDGKIESSAYGESPVLVIKKVFLHLELDQNDVFLDLGAGAGSVVLAAKNFVARSVGVEWNPELAAQAGESFPKGPDCQVIHSDFTKHDWFQATKVYAATARFSKNTLQSIADRLNEESQVQRVASLGRQLPLQKPWLLSWESSESVIWNDGEQALTEKLSVWERPLP